MKRLVHSFQKKNTMVNTKQKKKNMNVLAESHVRIAMAAMHCCKDDALPQFLEDVSKNMDVFAAADRSKRHRLFISLATRAVGRVDCAPHLQRILTDSGLYTDTFVQMCVDYRNRFCAMHSGAIGEDVKAVCDVIRTSVLDGRMAAPDAAVFVFANVDHTTHDFKIMDNCISYLLLAETIVQRTRDLSLLQMLPFGDDVLAYFYIHR
jgi:hypothetical protein